MGKCITILKVTLQILGRKFYKKNPEKSSLYSQSLLIFIHKTPVVENHPTTEEIKEILRPRSTPTAITVYFYMSISLNTANTQKKFSNIASDEDIMENNYMFVMLWNLSVISHLIFLQYFFFYSGAKNKNSLRGYVVF